MPEQEPDPFELQPAPPPKQPLWGGMPTIAPQEGVPVEGGSYFSLSPEAMQMMWAPQPQPQQVQLPPLPPPKPLV